MFYVTTGIAPSRLNGLRNLQVWCCVTHMWKMLLDAKYVYEIYVKCPLSFRIMTKKLEKICCHELFSTESRKFTCMFSKHNYVELRFSFFQTDSYLSKQKLRQMRCTFISCACVVAVWIKWSNVCCLVCSIWHIKGILSIISLCTLDQFRDFCTCIICRHRECWFFLRKIQIEMNVGEIDWIQTK